MHICVKRKCGLVLFIMSPGRSVRDAMKSLRSGLLATVVRGNQHSLQTAHQALQREGEGDRKRDT